MSRVSATSVLHGGGDGQQLRSTHLVHIAPRQALPWWAWLLAGPSSACWALLKSHTVLVLPRAEQVRESKKEIRKGVRDVEKEVRDMQMEEAKLVRELKAAAKTGNQASLKVLAKSLIRVRQQVSKLQASSAQLKGLGVTMVSSWVHLLHLKRHAPMRCMHACTRATCGHADAPVPLLPSQPAQTTAAATANVAQVVGNTTKTMTGEGSSLSRANYKHA
jgi:hypothetical protein